MIRLRLIWRFLTTSLSAGEDMVLREPHDARDLRDGQYRSVLDVDHRPAV